MFYLNLNYEVFESNNTVLFYDVFLQKTVLVISLKNLSYNEIRNHLFNGFDNKEMKHNTRLFEFLLEKHAYLFKAYNNRELVKYFRIFNAINKDCFVSFENYTEMVKRQMRILENDIYFVLDPSDISGSVKIDKFKQIPFVKIDSNSLDCDMKIITGDYNGGIKSINIEISEKEILIGPLNTKNGVAFSSINKSGISFELLNYEENIIVMFIEKISILIYLNLFDKMRFNYFVPFRFRLKYDRITSEIITDTEVEIYDC